MRVAIARGAVLTALCARLMSAYGLESVAQDPKCYPQSSPKPRIALPAHTSKGDTIQQVIVQCPEDRVERSTPDIAATPPTLVAPPIYAAPLVLGAAAKSADDSGFPWKAVIEALAKVISSLAWPIAALLIAKVFRTEIASLLGRLKSIKAGKTEAIFAEGLRKVESVADVQDGSDDEPSIPRTVAQNDPRGAILSAWVSIESEIARLHELVQSRTVSASSSYGRRTFSITVMLREIQNAQAVTLDDIETIKSLQRLRNQAAHAETFELAPDVVLRYVKIADDMAARLREALVFLKERWGNDNPVNGPAEF